MPAFSTDHPVALFDDKLGDSPTRRLSGWIGTLRCDTPAQIDATFAAIDAAQAAGHWVAIAAAFELGYALEARLAPQRPASDTPLLQAWIFRRCDVLDDAACGGWLTAGDGPAGLLDWKLDLARGEYLAAVERVQRYIAEGDCYQVNFTFPCSARAFGTPHALYHLLRTAQPVPYGAFIHHADGCILSRSPELFVARRGETLTCKPMKGTAPADASASALTESVKDRAENVMIVDLIRNDLGRLAPPGGVSVPKLFDVERYRTLWQMTSTVTAAPVTADLRTIFGALFPCGSVTGAPKIRAIEIIRELERTPRGVYCGALGWLAPDRDFCFNVPIRTLEIDPLGQVRFGTGSGIVHDSSPAGEWEECRLKTRFLENLPNTIELIETLRCEPAGAAPYPWLDDHLSRLCDSARAFAYPLDRAKVRARLEALAAAVEGPQRVRLTLAGDGAVTLTHAPLDTLPTRPTVVLADAALDPADPLLRHKTTARALYDATLKVAMAGGHFDALFFNTRGELAEGCRSNVFIERDGVLLTPPEAAGLLNGICRRRLLREGRAAEATLTREDLFAARRVYVGNAVRGLIEVRIV